MEKDRRVKILNDFNMLGIEIENYKRRSPLILINPNYEKFN